MPSDNNDPFGELSVFGDVSPIKSFPSQGGKEHRREPRYLAAWRVVVVVEGQAAHDGKLRDISPHGAAILIGRNLKPNISVTLHIYMHSLTGHVASKILIVHGVATYTVHDVYYLRFRVGITFVKFELTSDQAYLKDRLTNHHSKAV